MSAMTDPVSIARACYDAYVEKDRRKIEALLADDYRFTSPLDNALGREDYFRICWPNAGNLTAFDIVHAFAAGDWVAIVYEAATKSGKRFRNSELHRVQNGKLVETQVYFGWDLPHKVQPGRHENPSS